MLDDIADFLRLIYWPWSLLIIGKTDSLPTLLISKQRCNKTSPKNCCNILACLAMKCQEDFFYFISAKLLGYQMRRQKKRQNLSGLGKLLNRQLYLICWTCLYSNPERAFTCCTSTNLFSHTKGARKYTGKCFFVETILYLT